MTMYAEERQQAMAQLVAERGRVSVNAIAEQFDVTTETVRRDLSALERIGLLRRVHGGAVPASALAVIEAGLGERDQANTAEKDRIARAALDLLPHADGTVLLDAGSTTGRLASLLPRDLRLTVVTHAVPVAARLAGSAQVELHLLPGRVRTDHPGGGRRRHRDRARPAPRRRRRSSAPTALSTGHGLSTPDHEEAATKRAMVARRPPRRLPGRLQQDRRRGPVRFAELAEVDVLVTDDGIAADDRRALERAGVEVVVA